MDGAITGKPRAYLVFWFILTFRYRYRYRYRYGLGAMVIGHDRPFYAPSLWYIVAYASYSVRILGHDW